jgi:translation initiation factor 5
MTTEKAQKCFLGGIERLVGVSFPALLPRIAVVLKQAYDLELLEEEVILSWGQKPSKKYVSKDVSKEIRKKAEPFLTWLA